ncbi:hypothetical protein C3Y98_04310 [Methylotenera oryzisoli]|uniref:Restriction endonuclease n=1 Tax=Methylotenera oryzisoli TaxID=2080758 RepID=A0A4Y9VSQ8_9PROT|nr:hypothetical protein [Methylotenera oryzisoli]TFW72334.1 hypothetical protein C3Y98_04310 [Methylotenera oryzisoli]
MIISKPDLEKLFDKAISNVTKPNIAGSYVDGKAFELYALLKVLQKLKSKGYIIKAHSPSGLTPNELRFAGGPAKADKNKFTYCGIYNIHGILRFEAWISVEVMTLSAIKSSTLSSPASYHELDVAVFYPLKSTTCRPNIYELTFAASCKDTKFKKENLREVLGLRRETALLSSSIRSRARWFIKKIPADPAIPLMLFSKDVACIKYQQPVDKFGVYVRQLKFP